jgi:uncharacterized protein with HEPN domain
MKKDTNYLLDMLTAIQLIQSYTLGKSQQDLGKDQLLQDAVTRRIEILGEAARRVSEKMRSEMPDIPWYQIIGMRNILAHEYDDIDLDIVWRVIQQELPILIPILEREIAKRTKEL